MNKKPKNIVIYPKLNFYRNEGNGRDIYISSNQAGFYPNHFQISKKHPNYFNFKKSLNIKYEKNFNPKVFRYYGNGHGREDYILKNKDSFFKFDDTLNNKQNYYFKNLRNYNKKIKCKSLLKKSNIPNIQRNRIDKSIEILSKPKTIMPSANKDLKLLDSTKRDKFLKAYKYYLIN